MLPVHLPACWAQVDANNLTLLLCYGMIRYRGQVVATILVFYVLARLRVHNAAATLLRRLPKQPMAYLFAALHAKFFGGAAAGGTVAAKVAGSLK